MSARTLGAVLTFFALGSCQLSAEPVFAAASATPTKAAAVIPSALSGKLGYYFAAAPNGETPPAPFSAAAAALPSVEAGMVYDTDAVMALMQKLPAAPAARGLFGKAGLYLHLFDEAEDAVPLPMLAMCNDLDIYADRANPAEQLAQCDGHVYAVSVTSAGVLLTIDQQAERLYRLNPGAYALNGVPFLVE